MKTGNRDQESGIRTSGSGEFEETLRLIARLSAPEGLEERVQAGLRKAKSANHSSARILAWPEGLGLSHARLQNLGRMAAAAAIVAVVLGGSWRISSRFQPAQPASAIVLPPHNAAQGSFSSAGAMRTPQTLNGPIVSVTTAAHPAASTPKPAAKKPLRHGKYRTVKYPGASVAH